MREKIKETINTAVRSFEEELRAGEAYGEISRGLWKEPLIEIIPAEYPAGRGAQGSPSESFLFLKKAVSKDHLLPGDVLSGAKSVIVFFIPFQENIVASNTKKGMASKEWVTAYIKTNELVKKINDDIGTLLERYKRRTGKIPATHNFDEETLISGWSHRHIAYIAGMGSFGINNMLITEKGCCGRFGSTVTDYDFGIYAEREKRERCLNRINGSCGVCRTRCEVKALDGVFDRKKCYGKCLENAGFHKSAGYADVCGKCLAGLPCSTKDPSI
jgi:epoxyqueuosine reductase QueG